MEAVQRFIQMLRDSAIMRQQVYQVVFALLTLIGAKVDLPFIQEHGEAIVDGILTTASAIVAVYTMFTRATKPAPNLTETAKQKEKELVTEGKIPTELATHEVVKEVQATGQGGFARVGLLAGMGVIAIGMLAMLTGCPASMNPLAKAETVEQKVYAVYGTLTIFSERGASMLKDPIYPHAVKASISEAIRAAKPAADRTLEGVLAVTQMKADIVAGETSDDKLLIAAANLDKYYLELKPLVDDIVVAVTVGLRCYKERGAEFDACVAAGGVQ